MGHVATKRSIDDRIDNLDNGYFADRVSYGVLCQERRLAINFDGVISSIGPSNGIGSFVPQKCTVSH